MKNEVCQVPVRVVDNLMQDIILGNSSLEESVLNDEEMKLGAHYNYEKNVLTIIDDYMLLVQTDSDKLKYIDETMKKLELKEIITKSKRDELLMKELNRELEEMTIKNRQKAKA